MTRDSKIRVNWQISLTHGDSNLYKSPILTHESPKWTRISRVKWQFLADSDWLESHFQWFENISITHKVQMSFLTYVTCSRPNSFYTSMSETCSGFMSVQLIAPTLSSLSPAPSTIVMSASETISQTEVKYRKTWMLSTWSATLYNLMSQKGNGRVACTARALWRGNMQPFNSLSET